MIIIFYTNIAGLLVIYIFFSRLKEWFDSEEYKAGQYINAHIAVWHGKE